MSPSPRDPHASPRPGPSRPPDTAASDPGLTQTGSGLTPPTTPNFGVVGQSADGRIDHGRFPPGQLFGGRYRIIELLGTGGMGEVYRADDLTLGQTVALKFLSAGRGDDPAALQEMQREVRVARQISHANICRVYDLGEHQGQPFISMEYIDGENLASLLRRVGRFPQDRAVELARQLCAGIAAAHSSGVLHRDLKPTNIMIDGRGRLRITDFGLAAAASQVREDQIRAGTPAYQAPEQLEGREVTGRSDIYAAGLILYEIFTGKSAFSAVSYEDLRRGRRDAAPTRPSTHVPDLDPVIERVVLRCLDQEPANRPASPLAVSMALPGGDPLAAALAAGELPSPEMVAAAVAPAASSLRTAIILMAVVLVGVVAAIVGNPRRFLYGYVPMPKSPEVLADRCQTLVDRLGRTRAPADVAHGLMVNVGYLNALAPEVANQRSNWDDLRVGVPSAYEFWYRESPIHLKPAEPFGLVTWSDPPTLVTRGSAGLTTDMHGRLTYFYHILETDDALAAQPADDALWQPLLDAVGAPPDGFEPVPPERRPPMYADRRAAWRVTFPGRPELPFRLEAAALGRRIVYANLLEPWAVSPSATQPAAPPRPVRADVTASAGSSDSSEPSASAMQSVPNAQSASAAQPAGRSAAALRAELTELTGLVVMLLCLPGAAFLAWRSVRLRRGDPRSAARLAWFVLISTMIFWLLRGNHNARQPLEELRAFILACGMALFGSAWTWMLYMALEPYVRKWWPHALIGWTRLLSGCFACPHVCREVLFGHALGAGTHIVLLLMTLIPGWFGGPDPLPRGVPVEQFLGIRHLLGWVISAQAYAATFPMIVVVVLSFARVIAPRSWMADIVTALLFVTIGTFSIGDVSGLALFVNGALGLCLALLWLEALKRLGLLTIVAGSVCITMLGAAAVPLDWNAWYATRALLIPALVVAVALYAFRRTTAAPARAL